jgi:acyl-homoserine-lactone acylase
VTLRLSHRIAGTLGLAAGALLVGGALTQQGASAWRPAPATAGTQSSPAARQRPQAPQRPPRYLGPPIRRPSAEILWDTWGVPHIFASDRASAFRAFGWAQMADHAQLLLQLVARARGTAAEYFGPKELDSDRTVAILGVDELARKWYARQPPSFRRDLDAYARGINEYAGDHPGAIQAAVRPLLPVTGADVMAMSIRVNYAFLALTGGCAEYLPPGIAPGRPPMAGSNGWAIGPSHSADGHAMLLANPHLPWWGEFTWQEAQIVVPGEYDAYGAALVGMPVLAIAFNQHLGWTHTVNTIDACDVYDLTPDGDGYLYDGRKRHFLTHTATLHVREPGGKLLTQTITVRRSVQGPVVERKGRLYAVRVAGLQVGSFAGSLEEWWQMGRARNLTEFEAALRRMQLSMFNAIYADDKGHILLLFNGLVPRRPEGNAAYWSRSVPGDTSETLWTRLLPYSALPKSIDPASGWVQNSNSTPWYMTQPMLDPDHFAPYISFGFHSQQGWPSLREQRGMQMLTQTPKFTYEQLIHDKYSTRSGLADRILTPLLSAARASSETKAREAATVLAKWDRHFDATSRGAVLFAEWAREAQRQGVFFSEGFDPKRELDTPRGLKDSAVAARLLAGAAATVEKNYGRLDVPWGDVFRFHRGKVDLPANGATGSYGVFRVITYEPEGQDRFRADGGDSFIAVVEFSHPLKARVLLDYGESSDPASPHFGDQLRLAAPKELRPAWLDREEILRHLESRTVFDANGIVATHAGATH